MARPRKLPQNGERIHVVFPGPLARRLRLLAAHLNIPISLLIQGMIQDRLPAKELDCHFPLRAQEPMRHVLVHGIEPFPEPWDGSDLKQRLYALHRTQKEIVQETGIPQQTLNRWVNKGFVPQDKQDLLKRLLEGWMKGSRTGEVEAQPEAEGPQSPE
jgi:hypothetical protein